MSSVAAAVSGGCPVVGGKTAQPPPPGAPEPSADSCGSARTLPSGCPVLNAESQVPPNQARAAGQRKALPTDRVTSSIPTSGDGNDPLWMYPSEQQFFNAMRRKGYNPKESDMRSVVAIHNAVNERTWAEVQRREPS